MQPQLTLFGFATLDALFGRFDAVIDRVANQVRERIADGLDDRLVHVDVFAADVQRNGLAHLVGQIANDTFELVEDDADRLHACRHDRFLEFRGDQVDALHR